MMGVRLQGPARAGPWVAGLLCIVGVGLGVTCPYLYLRKIIVGIKEEKSGRCRKPGKQQCGHRGGLLCEVLWEQSSKESLGDGGLRGARGDPLVSGSTSWVCGGATP